jgi:hypothetical protein
MLEGSAGGLFKTFTGTHAKHTPKKILIAMGAWDFE